MATARRSGGDCYGFSRLDVDHGRPSSRKGAFKKVLDRVPKRKPLPGDEL